MGMSTVVRYIITMVHNKRKKENQKNYTCAMIIAELCDHKEMRREWRSLLMSSALLSAFHCRLVQCLSDSVRPCGRSLIVYEERFTLMSGTLEANVLYGCDRS